MSTPGDPNCTMRCGICATNWPFYRQFMECPVCEQATSPLKFTSSDDILTVEQANEILRDHGLAVFHPKGRMSATQIRDHVSELYHDLERWAHEEPPWMK